MLLTLVVTGLLGVADAPREYDAYLENPTARALTEGLRPEALELLSRSLVTAVEPRRGVPTILWAERFPGARAPREQGLTAPEAARQHLLRYAAVYRLRPELIARLIVSEVHDLGRGAVVVGFARAHEGVPLLRDELDVVMTERYELVAFTGSLATEPRPLGEFRLSAQTALATAAQHLGGTFAPPELLRLREVRPGGWSLHEAAGLFASPPRARRVYFDDGFTLRPAWHLEVETASKLHALVISAVDGRLLSLVDLEASATHTYRAWADTAAPFRPLDSPVGDVALPHPTGGPDGFDPAAVTANLVTLDNAGLSSNDPWLPVGAAELSGNNAHAYADLVAPDGLDGGRLRGGAQHAPRTFDSAYDLGQPANAAPSQRSASATHAFFVTNWLHDAFYDLGFDETARNGQADNFGRGGLGGDAVNVEVHDYAGRNNANFRTRADGDARPPAALPLRRAARQHAHPHHRRAGRRRHLPGRAPRRDPGAHLGRHRPGGGGDRPRRRLLGLRPLGQPGLPHRQRGDGRRGHRLQRGPPLRRREGRGRGGAHPQRRPAASPSPSPRWWPSAWRRTRAPRCAISRWAARRCPRTWCARPASTSATWRSTPPWWRTSSPTSSPAGWWVTRWGCSTAPRARWARAGATSCRSGARRARDRHRAAGERSLAGRLRHRRLDRGRPRLGRRAAAGALLRLPALPLLHRPQRRTRSPSSTWAPTCRCPRSAWRRATSAAAPTTPRCTTPARCGPACCWDAQVKLLRKPGVTTDAARAPSWAATWWPRSRPPRCCPPSSRRATRCWRWWRPRAPPSTSRSSSTPSPRRGLGALAQSSDRRSTTNTPLAEDFTGAGGNYRLVSVTVDDNDDDCDGDGQLDTNETGTLTVKLLNVGSRRLTRSTLRLSSSSPQLQLSPAAVNVLPSDPFTVVTVTVPTSLGLVSGFQSSVITVDVQDPDLSLLQGRFEATATVRLNVDLVPALKEGFENGAPGWAFDGDGNFPWEQVWFVRPINAVTHTLTGRGMDGVGESTATTPPLAVGAGPFSVTFTQSYLFETSLAMRYFDGGRLEISTDGLTFTAVPGSALTPSYPVTLEAGTTNPLAGQAAYGGAQMTAQTVTADFGTQYANRTVWLRWRIGTDEATGTSGWTVDDVQVSGLTTPPFTDAVPHRGLCTNHPPVVSGTTSITVSERNPVTLVPGTVSDRDLDALTITWMQTSGPSVQLMDDTFIAPEVTTAGAVLGFRVSVSDGRGGMDTDDMTVTVRNVNRRPEVLAGGTTTVVSGQVATLEATGTDPDGDGLTYLWQQEGIATVTIAEANAAQTSFVAPEVKVAELISFRVIALDSDTASEPAFVAITVTPKPSSCGCSSVEPLLAFGLLLLARRRRR